MSFIQVSLKFSDVFGHEPDNFANKKTIGAATFPWSSANGTPTMLKAALGSFANKMGAADGGGVKVFGAKNLFR